MNVAPTVVAPTRAPTITDPWEQPREAPVTRPHYDPDEVREPDKLCPQQKREQAWEAV